MSDRCVEPLRFPRRIENRPALERIAYRIGDYADIREVLLRGLDREPLLRRWTHRGADDPGIALMEGAAVLGDILTFYQELYANEAYLRTARWRESVADLVRLTGYRLSPGLGGRGLFAFEVEGERAIPIPAGTPLQAQVTGLEAKADFQTSAAITAWPWLSRFSLYRPLETPAIGPATRSFEIVSSDAPPLREGDRLLLGTPVGSGRLEGAELVVVENVETLHERRLVTIKGALRRSGSVASLRAYKIGRSFRHFGHAAPPTVTTVNSSGVASQSAVNLFRWLPLETDWFEPALQPLELPLAQTADDLAQGSTLIVQGLFYVFFGVQRELTLLRQAKAVTAASYTLGALTAPASLVTLDSDLSTTLTPADGVPVEEFYSLADLRKLAIHETLGAPLELLAAPEETAASGGYDLFLLATGAEAAALQQRLLLLDRGDGEPEEAVVQAVDLAGSERRLRQVTLDLEVSYADFPNREPGIAVLGNIAEATQGKAEAQAKLGNGDARQVFQTFKLPKAPLTYLLDAGAAPPEAAELEIFVGGRLWSRVDSFFGQDPKAQVYILREDAENNSLVQFGDGKTGARLPTGVGNVVALYRSGQGAFGALAPDTKVTAGARIERLKQVGLPGPISGGEEPEPAGKAREAAPGKLQALGRLVSLQDYETETLALPGVRRARGAWELLEGTPAVVVTVLMDQGREAEIDAIRETLEHANRCRGPARLPVVVLAGSLRPCWLAAEVTVDPSFRETEVLAAVTTALLGDAAAELRGLFTVERRRFAGPEYATRVEGTIQAVAGVLWNRVTGFGPSSAAAGPTPPAQPWPRAEVVPCGSQQILSLDPADLALTPGAPPAAGEC